MDAERTPNDFRPTADWSRLKLRAELLRKVRAFFDAHQFLEVETPILSADVVVDRHLDPFETAFIPDPRRPEAAKRLWLQTSPEFGMKRLMASGGEAIYQITRAFRQGEIGQRHNPEFTIVEWYRRGDDMQQGMQLLSDLCEALLARGAAERLSYTAAFERHAGIHPLTAEVVSLRKTAEERGIVVPESLGTDDRDAWLDLLLVELVEPHLGMERPTILCDYPPSQAALARTRQETYPLAERFELYVQGVELANGYHELLDAAVLRTRNHEQNVWRRKDGKPPLPVESRLLTAMEQGLPACTGVALGFDRVVMLAAGVTSLAEVLAFPIDRA